MNTLSRYLVALTALGIATIGFAQAPSEGIVNYREYSEHFASSGQPSAEQLETLQQAGFEQVIYIAFSDHDNALAGEDRIVKSLGMGYAHIPVIWNAPQQSDFELFAASMRAAPERKTLLHCQVNFRASAFAMLYRVIYQDVPLVKAKADMNSVWVPDATWTQFIHNTLTAHDIDPHCKGCDWTPATY